MSNDGQDDKNVNNDQVQLNDNNSSNNQDQKENTSTNNDAKTPEAVTSPSNANISGEQNTVQVTNASNEVQKPEVTTNDLAENDEKSINNEQRQLQSNTNIGKNQNKASLNNQEDKEGESELDKLLSRIDKGEPPQKLEDAQVKNMIGDIKAQMAAAINNYAELDRLVGALAALAASTNNPELLATIEAMLNEAGKQEDTAKEVIRNDATSENLARILHEVCLK